MTACLCVRSQAVRCAHNGLSFPLLLEYAAINSMLDQINSCLDHLEEKNDHLHVCLKELLESNRQTRLEFQQQSKHKHSWQGLS
uniref:Uncharacterized protein n=1 Tax=Zosterops lateralis melanops TaxID=1220523 RepID=A0A8D2PRA9_ZOSLA